MKKYNSETWYKEELKILEGRDEVKDVLSKLVELASNGNIYMAYELLDVYHAGMELTKVISQNIYLGNKYGPGIIEIIASIILKDLNFKKKSLGI